MPPAKTDPVDFSAHLRLSLSSDDLFGKCDDSMEFRLPSELKDALKRHAAKRRMTAGACLRLLIATNVMGQEHVTSVLVERLSGFGAPARTSAPTEQQESL